MSVNVPDEHLPRVIRALHALIGVEYTQARWRDMDRESFARHQRRLESFLDTFGPANGELSTDDGALRIARDEASDPWRPSAWEPIVASWAESLVEILKGCVEVTISGRWRDGGAPAWITFLWEEEWKEWAYEYHGDSDDTDLEAEVDEEHRKALADDVEDARRDGALPHGLLIARGQRVTRQEAAQTEGAA